jgi:hypothetical protein
MKNQDRCKTRLVRIDDEYDIAGQRQEAQGKYGAHAKGREHKRSGDVADGV